MDTTNNTLQSPGFSAFNMDKTISFIRPYDPKAIGIDGYRHSVIRYRQQEKNGKIVSAAPAKMVTIPVVQLPENDYLMPETAMKVLIGTIEDQQDTLIKDAIACGASLINWSDVDLDASLAALTAVRVSTRMTKEQIEAWVKVALVTCLNNRADQISDNGNFDATKRVLQRQLTLNAYADNFSKLSAPVPNLGQEKATMLKNVLTLSQVADDIAEALKAKLEVILNPKVTEDGNL